MSTRLALVAVVAVLALACKSEKGSAEGSSGSSESAGGDSAGKGKAKPPAKPTAGAVPIIGDDTEVEVKFYLQPDGSGSKTENKLIELDNGTIEFQEANADGIFNRGKRAATPEEVTAIHDFVKGRFKSPVKANLEYPRIEVGVEIGEAEVDEEHAVGKVPADYVAFQKLFFQKTFE